MQHGANARVGLYPHRDATSPLTIATDRGYDEIVSIIREEERHRQERRSGVTAPVDDVILAIRSGNDARALALLDSDPTLIRSRHAVFDVTPLMVAAQMLNARLVTSLLDRGADPNERGLVHPFDDIEQRRSRDLGQTALDVAAYRVGLWGEGADGAPLFRDVAKRLLDRGAELTPRGAAAIGDTAWLRARHTHGTLTNRLDEGGGLLRISVSHDRPEVLHLLLECGFDPDERTRFRDVGADDVAVTWGMPLWHCAAASKLEMAEVLLAHGADPNAAVYGSGTPISEAFGQGDWRMIALLEQRGGRVEPSVAAQYRQLDHVRASMAAAPDKAAWAETILGPAACGGSPDIVRLALAHLEWARDDPRWFGALEQPLRIWHHSGRHWARPDWDRAAYQTCFRMLLERCDPNVRGRSDGASPLDLTVLHSVAGSRDHVTAEERLAFATMLLDAGASLDVRDAVLKSTPLGWACRWGRTELVRLYLARGADLVEADSEPWAKPIVWAEKKGHREIVELLHEYAPR
jgi:hypothetical protein